MDFRQYAQVDRTTLLEVLITRRMFRQAMVIVEEFGYEGLDLSCLLKMTSRMILKSDMAEDDELLALASEVYRKGKYDEVILHYLMLYRFGPLDELISIWKSARGFEMDTYDLEERILSLLIFTEDYRKEGEAVLESYEAVRKRTNHRSIPYTGFLWRFCQRIYNEYVHQKQVGICIYQ